MGGADGSLLGLSWRAGFGIGATGGRIWGGGALGISLRVVAWGCAVAWGLAEIPGGGLSGAIRTTKIVWPDLISSPLASAASFARAPFRNVPLLLFKSRKRQPFSSHSTAKCAPDISLSWGTANWARSGVRPMTMD